MTAVGDYLDIRVIHDDLLARDRYNYRARYARAKHAMNTWFQIITCIVK